MEYIMLMIDLYLLMLALTTRHNLMLMIMKDGTYK